MIPQPAARRYAEGAYLIAREAKKEDAWRSGLQSIAALFGNPDADRVFASSSTSAENKRQLVEKSLEGLDREVLNLARLLLRRGRTMLGPQISLAYEEILDRANGISHAMVTSAVPLSQDELAAVQEKLEELTGGTVVVQTEVDESILGGLIVRIGDRLIDGSTRSRLVALKQRLAGTRS
jgi:F-type H+-transporting ATPase subunit delta